jgi:adenylate cyclase
MFPLKKFSIRNVLLFLLMGEITVIIGLTGWLWYQNGQKAVKEVASHLRDELTARIHQHIEKFLETPPLINQINADIYNMGGLNIDDVEQLEEYFWRQINAFENISYIDLGTEKGDFIGLERMENGAINLEYKTRRTEGNSLLTFRLDEQRNRVSRKVRPDFYTQGRPWYTKAIEDGKPTWTGIYPFFSLPVRLGITAVRPIHDKSGNVVGVLGSDLVLTQISQFLRTLRVGKTGRTFIMEPNGMLVASSSDLPPVISQGNQMMRIYAFSFGDDLIRAASLYLKQTFTTFANIKEVYQTSFVFNDQKVLLQAVPTGNKFGLNWISVVVLPESDFMASINANTKQTAILFILLITAAGITILFTTRRISRPILAISEEMDRISGFNVEGGHEKESRLREISLMQNSMQSMKRGLRSFAKYVPRDVVQHLFSTKQEAVLGLKKVQATVLFTDVVGFTSIAEKESPDTLVKLMEEYLEEMSQIISETKGTVDKYIGDSIMAFWNAPGRVDNHQHAAVKSAVLCQKRLKELRKEWEKQDLPLLHQRIGIHTGSILVGNFGSSKRMNYTAIGDAVNLTQRLESINKLYGTEIIISGDVYGYVANTFLCRPLDLVSVKGKTTATKIYEVIEEFDNVSEEQRACVGKYKQILDCYFKREFSMAKRYIVEYLKTNPTDKAANLLLQRCHKFERTPPDKNWKGANKL